MEIKIEFERPKEFYGIFKKTLYEIGYFLLFLKITIAAYVAAVRGKEFKRILKNM